MDYFITNKRSCHISTLGYCFELFRASSCALSTYRESICSWMHNGMNLQTLQPDFAPSLYYSSLVKQCGSRSRYSRVLVLAVHRTDPHWQTRLLQVSPHILVKALLLPKSHVRWLDGNRLSMIQQTIPALQCGHSTVNIFLFWAVLESQCGQGKLLVWTDSLCEYLKLTICNTDTETSRGYRL